MVHWDYWNQVLAASLMKLCSLPSLVVSVERNTSCMWRRYLVMSSPRPQWWKMCGFRLLRFIVKFQWLKYSSRCILKTKYTVWFLHKGSVLPRKMIFSLNSQISIPISTNSLVCMCGWAVPGSIVGFDGFQKDKTLSTQILLTIDTVWSNRTSLPFEYFSMCPLVERSP